MGLMHKPGITLVCGAGLLGASIVAAPAALADEHLHALGASLFGANEVGHQGAGEDASGDFSGEIDMEAGTLCYYLEVEELDGFTAAHIHKGKEGKNGPPVVVLELTGEDGEETCAQVDGEVLAAIASDHEDYYVNVHTSEFPAGAIRGQLGS